MPDSPIKKAALIAAVLLFIILQYRLWFDDSGLIASFRLDKQIQEIAKQNQQAQKRNQSLLDEVQDLHRGSEMLEEFAREDLGMVKKGEQFFLFIEPEEPKEAPAHSNTENKHD